MGNSKKEILMAKIRRLERIISNDYESLLKKKNACQKIEDDIKRTERVCSRYKRELQKELEKFL